MRLLTLVLFLLFLSPFSFGQQGQQPSRSEPYKIGIFPAHGHFGYLDRQGFEGRTVELVGGVIKAQPALSLSYSSYDTTYKKTALEKTEKLWTGSVTRQEPNLQRVSEAARARGLNAVVMVWGDSPGTWGIGNPPAGPPIEMYLIDIERQRVYRRKGHFVDAEGMIKQLISAFLQGAPPVVQVQAAPPVAPSASKLAAPPPVQVAVSPGAGPVTVAAGTPVSVTLVENVNSGLNTIGETVYLRVAEDVAVKGQIVIRKGARAKGQVGNIGQRGMMGKGGDIDFSPISIEAIDGQWIPLDKDNLGARGAGASAKGIIGIGLWAKGRAAFVLRDEPYQVTIRRDTVIDTSKVQPQAALRPAALRASAKFEEVPDIKFSRAKHGKDIVLEIELTPELAALVSQDPRSVEIVQVFDDLLHQPVKSMSIERDARRGALLRASFDWWSVIRYAKPGATPVTVHCKLTDGRIVQAQVALNTDWTLK